MPIDYDSFGDTAIELPDPSNGDIDTEVEFNTPGVDGTKAGVLSFQVNPTGTPTVRIEINGTTVLTRNYDDPTPGGLCSRRTSTRASSMQTTRWCWR